MDLSHTEIRAFNATINEGSFSKAALLLNVSQPAITAQIRKLEARFQQSLLERYSRGVRPTRLGEQLFNITRQYQDLDTAVTALMSPTQSGSLYELSIATASPIVFLPLIADFNNSYPNATLKVRSTTTDKCRELVMRREVDLGLFPMPEDEQGIAKLPYHEHRLMAIIPKNCPIQATERVSVMELIQHPLIFRKKNSCTQLMVERAFHSKGLNPEAHLWMDARFDMIEAVKFGLGVGFALANDITEDDSYRLLAIDESEISVQEHVVWHKSRTEHPGIREFVNLALERCCLSMPFIETLCSREKLLLGVDKPVANGQVN